MEHSYFKDRISAFHDNELKNEEKQLIADHLATCAECRKLLAELERFDAMVEKHSGLADDEYWEKSAQKIEAALGAEQKTKIIEIKRTSYRGLGWKLAGIAASVAIIAFIALYESDIREQVEKRSQATEVEMPAPSRDSIPDSAAGSFADLGAPVAEKLEAQEQNVAEDELKKDKSDVVRNKSGEVFIRGGRAASTTYVTEEGANEAEVSVEAKREAISPSEAPEDSAYDYMPRLSQIEVYQSVPRLIPRDSEGTKDRVYPDEDLNEVADEEAGLTLEQWRQKRDSLQSILADKKDLGTASKLAETQAPLVAKMDKRQLALVVDSISKELEKQDPVLALLETQYQIARLTDSEKERDEAIKFLQTYLDKEDSEYKLQAAFYLQQLDQQ